MNLTGAISVIALTNHADDVERVQMYACQQPTPEVLTTTRTTATELAWQFGWCYHAADKARRPGTTIR
jgi:hypothetical protein